MDKGVPCCPFSLWVVAGGGPVVPYLQGLRLRGALLCLYRGLSFDV